MKVMPLPEGLLEAILRGTGSRWVEEMLCDGGSSHQSVRAMNFGGVYFYFVFLN